jgi:hypothetical protein
VVRGRTGERCRPKESLGDGPGSGVVFFSLGYSSEEPISPAISEARLTSLDRDGRDCAEGAGDAGRAFA